MHVDSLKHKKAVRGEASSAKVTDYFCKPGTQTEDNVAAAEATMSFHTVKHHHSYRSNDCCSILMRKLFQIQLFRKNILVLELKSKLL